MQIVDIQIRDEKDPNKRNELLKQKQVIGLKIEIEKIRNRIAQLS